MAKSVLPPMIRVKLSTISAYRIYKIHNRLGLPAPGLSGRMWEKMWEDIALVAKEVLDEKND